MKNFKDEYQKVRIELQKELGLKSIEAVPRITKVSVNVGTGSHASEANYAERVAQDLASITGQKPVVTKSRKSIAGFKLREGMPVGVAVTLRSQKMFDFLNKLVNITLPRVRDFQGISAKSFDGHGNYTLGIKEHVVFPELMMDNIERTFSLEVTITTNAKSDDLSKALLTKLHFPFKK